MSKTVVIVGGGFGAVRCALDLSAKLLGHRIILISSSPWHCYTPDLYEAATAKLTNTTRFWFEDLTGTVNIPLIKILEAKLIELFIEKVQKIDLEQKVVQTDKQEFKYDYLVLGLGSNSNYFNIPGAADFAHPFKTTEDALNIRNDLSELCFRKDRKQQILIAGGGFSGVELAGELRGYLPKTCEITIVEALENILNGMPDWSQKEALARLTKLKIRVLTSLNIASVRQHEITSTLGQKLQYDYLIWTAGIKGENLDGRIWGVEFAKKDQIAVTECLNLKNFPEVFVLGDLAQINDTKRNLSIPKTAWAAISEGRVVAQNITASINHQDLRQFTPPYPSFIVPIGGKFAITNLFGLEMTGFVVWIIKQVVALKYLLSILSVDRALTTWWKGVTLYIRND